MCFTLFSWTIYIYDGIPNSQITFHLRSKDDDLGYHNITDRLGYQFSFCVNLSKSTLFYGDFFYGTKKGHFNVYEVKVAEYLQPKPFKRAHAYWLLKSDGYYLSKLDIPYDDPGWKLWGNWEF